MQLFVVVYDAPGQMADDLKWFASKREAAQEAERAGGQAFSVEVPTNKAGLLSLIRDSVRQSPQLERAAALNPMFPLDV